MRNDVASPSFSLVVDDGCREKVKEAQEENPAIFSFQKKIGDGQAQEQGDPGFFEEPVDGAVDD